MANGYLRNGLDKQRAVFHFFFRKNPFNGGYAVAAGLETLLRFAEQAQFNDDDLRYLESLTNPRGNRIFDRNFIRFLEKFRFTVDIYAVPEGSVVFAHEPLIRVEGNLPECQLIETILCNIINFQTLIATKASRMLLASGFGELIEFGMRRSQGTDGALSASRAAYVGGFSATSNVEAGKHYGIPLRGTHSHSWVLSYPSEEEAFYAFYQDISGKLWHKTGDGVRPAHAGWGVQAWLYRNRGQPAYKIKLSEETAKINIPGRLQVRRYYGNNGQMLADAIYDTYTGTPQPGSLIYSPNDPIKQKKITAYKNEEDLLVKVMENGKCIHPGNTLDKIRKQSISNLKSLDKSICRFINPHYYPAGIEERLYKHRNKLIASLKQITLN
ncbi:hypothetical protein CHS0354_001948 [Potamilus streckersoni]|uniref:nicotinate phosphoribosyltransferase n=1 Tax=Potamilus streckersoni TaxID=2493646 RepID=A0AAE0W7B5_9BIVA|nr:hypothetical protein CHS0354_001948 [Potamilus streckersoni]